MKSVSRRITRLADVQEKFSMLLKARLQEADREKARLEATCRGLSSLAARTDAASLSLMPSTLRSLSAAEARLREVEEERQGLHAQIIEAEARTKSFQRKAVRLIEKEARKEAEADALELALGLAATVSGKRNVVI